MDHIIEGTVEIGEVLRQEDPLELTVLTQEEKDQEREEQKNLTDQEVEDLDHLLDFIRSL